MPCARFPAVPRRILLPTCAAVFLLALLLRLVPLALQGGLTGSGGIDEGVYYVASRATGEGSMPYRDFTFLHPPGILWLMRPTALLGALVGDPAGYAAARVVMALLGAGTAALVALLAARYGPVAAAVAGLAYATWPGAVGPERMILLAGPLNFFLVAGALALSRAGGAPGRVRAWTVAGGGLLAAALSVKLWALGPLAVLLVALLLTRGARALGTALVGLASVLLLTFGPAVLPAPAGALNQMAGGQADRRRLDSALGVRLGLFPVSGEHDRLVVPFVLLVAVTAVVVLVLLRRRGALRGRERPLPAVAVWTVAGIVCLAELVVAPALFSHYPALVGPWAALVLGAVFGLVLRRFRPEVGVPPGYTGREAAARPATGRDRAPVLARGAVALAGTGLAIWFAADLSRDVQPRWMARPDGPRLQAMASTDGCAWTARPGDAVIADRLGDNLERGCPVVVDWTGMQIMEEAGLPFPEQRTALPGRSRVHEIFADQAATAEVLLDHEGDTAALTPADRARLHALFDRTGNVPPVQVWRRE